MGLHLYRRRRHRNSLSAARLSQLTWTAADRKAWVDAYRAARRCSDLRALEADIMRPYSGQS